MTKRTKPYIFLEDNFNDADYLISIEWNKLHKEYLIDCLRWWSRELSYFKIEWDDIYTKVIEMEYEDDHARSCKLGFRSYYTIRNWIFVEELQKSKYDSWDQLEFYYFESKRYRKKLIWKESERSIDNDFNDPAKTYIFYHALGKEKAKEYGEKAIKRLLTKEVIEYKEKLEKLYAKYWAKLVYDWPESVNFDIKLPEDKWDDLWEEKEEFENYRMERALWDVEEIKLIMENWNVPECERRTFNFKEDAIKFAESKKGD